MHNFHEELIWYETPGLMTGIETLDSLIGGLQLKAELITITGESNSGRDLLFLSVMKSCFMNEIPCLYFCNHNNKFPELIWASFLGYRYNDWNYKLIEKIKSDETKRNHEEELNKLLINSRLEYHHGDIYDMRNIYDITLHSIREKGTKMVFIDNLQGIPDSEGRGLSKIVQSLKTLSVLANVTIILSSMLSESYYLRKTNNTCPLLSDLGLMGHLDEFSDIVLSVHQSKENDKKLWDTLYSHGSWKLDMYLDVLKNHRGGLGRGIMQIESHYKLLDIGTSDSVSNLSNEYI